MVVNHVHKADRLNLNLKLAALLHDIGKPKSAKPNKEGNMSYPEHDKASAEMAEKILKELQYDKAIVKDTLHLIRQHMFDYKFYNPAWNDFEVAKWVRGLAGNKKSLLELMTHREGDTTSQLASRKEIEKKKHDDMMARLNGLDLDKILSMKSYADGNDIQQVFQRQGGKWVEKVKEQLLDLQLQEKIKSKDEALDFLKSRQVADDGVLIS